MDLGTTYIGFIYNEKGAGSFSVRARQWQLEISLIVQVDVEGKGKYSEVPLLLI